MLKKFLSKLSVSLLSAGVFVTRLEKKLYGSIMGLPQKPSTLKPHAEDFDDDPPVVLEPLPDEVVFKAMFERKFGKFGTCLLQISGQPRHFNSDELYEILTQIQERAKNNDIKTEEDEFLVQLYSVLLDIIVRGQGENLDQNSLN